LGFHAASAAHGFEGLSHLGVLAEEVVDVLDGGSGAVGYALAAAVVVSFGLTSHSRANEPTSGDEARRYGGTRLVGVRQMWATRPWVDFRVSGSRFVCRWMFDCCEMRFELRSNDPTSGDEAADMGHPIS
jgi:hypothetical protein